MTLQQKYKIAIQALRDVRNPVERFRRELPEGARLDGYMTYQLCSMSETYKNIASTALKKLRLK